MKAGTASLRYNAAREAATLLYFGLEKEYKQAKLKAAENLGIRILPSNMEVALALDRVAEENEGPARTDRLIAMRREALEIMRVLKVCCPLLLGSVWRGTIRRGSDIDIAVYHDEPQEVVTLLKSAGLDILKTEQTVVTKSGKNEWSFHIHVQAPSKQHAEIVVRGVEEAGKKRLCETFGDEIRGLKLSELERVLEENPAQRFLPS